MSILDRQIGRTIWFPMLPAIALLLSACNPIGGTFTVAERLALDITKVEHSDSAECAWDEGWDDCEVSVAATEVFMPGSYAAELSFDAENELSLTLTAPGQPDKVVNVAIPDGTSFPRYGGEFALASRDIGQPYDLHGLVDTRQSSSPVYGEWESCTYRIRRRICRGKKHHQGEGRRHGKHGGGGCKQVAVTIHGQRPVEYQDQYLTRRVDLALLAESSQTTVGRFEGSQTSSRRHYVYVGACR